MNPPPTPTAPPLPLPAHLTPSLHDEPPLAPDAGDDAPPHITIGTQLLNAAAIVIPFLGLLAAIAITWGWGVGWGELAVLAVMYLLTAGGVTVGFHRHFTHKSFSTSRPVQWLLGILGSMSMQGTLLGWVATHRCHHQFSDRPGDPHSPHVDHDHAHMGGGLTGLVKGYLHAHLGWLFHDDPANLAKYIPDLLSDPTAQRISRLFVLWVALGILLPGVALGLLTGTWWGFFSGMLWGGLVRLFLVHHVTWSINSACHLWGQRTYKSHDHSRNNALFGVLALGEGWHNNHHAFPTSARHGLEWWQFDLSYLLIRSMAALGLVWDVKTPSRHRLEARKLGDTVVGPHGQPVTYTPRDG
ncbi:MAG: acyl-CoA desaturase [Tepidisphaerales bacterium]